MKISWTETKVYRFSIYRSIEISSKILRFWETVTREHIVWYYKCYVFEKFTKFWLSKGKFRYKYTLHVDILITIYRWILIKNKNKNFNIYFSLFSREFIIMWRYSAYNIFLFLFIYFFIHRYLFKDFILFC